MNKNGVPIQPELVSGSNIKSLNSQTLLGAGNLLINNGVNGFQFCEIIPTNGTTVVSSTVQTLTYSALIPANTFESGGLLELTCRILKTGTVSTSTSYIYKNTSPTLTGATLIGTGLLSQNALNIFMQYIRTFRITGGILGAFPSSVSALIDNVSSTGNSESTTAFDINVDNYILISIQLSSNADTLTGALLQMLGYE